MARRGPGVAWTKAEAGRIPDSLTTGVALVLDLARRDKLGELADRVRIRREGGFSGVDVLLFMLLYFAMPQRTGLRSFWEVVRPHSRQLASTADRTRLASPASISRALDSVELELMRPVVPWLLAEMSGIDRVLRHSAVQTHDARGRGWHVFDYDPTVHALRHRALPEDDDSPAARLRSERIAAPGHRGRKRGDVQLRRGTLQHAGSGAWLGCWLAPGSTERAEGLDRALDVVVETTKRLDHPRDRSLLRIDGEYGWVPYYSACRAHGVAFMTRLTRPELLDEPIVQRRLVEAEWHHVPDSGSGPRRSAIDLGIVTVPSGKDTRRSDGSAYEPVDVRVVVCRFPREGKPGRGSVADGWQYEMFAVDVDADAWPAPAAVAMYFGRAGQENRFAQEDREVGLDRIFSYALAGQEFAVTIGLWVWNMRIARGFELDVPPDDAPVQATYVPKVDTRSAPPPTAAPDVTTDAELSSPSLNRAPAPLSTTNTADIVQTLAQLEWSSMLASRHGWSWDPATGEIICADGRRLVLTTVQKEHAPGRTSLIFCRPEGGCAACPSEHRCLRSKDPRRAKHLQLAVPTAIAAKLREQLCVSRRTARCRPPVRPEPASATSPTSPPLNVQPRFAIRPVIGAPGPLLDVAPSLFLPAKARQAVDATALGASVLIEVPLPPPVTPPPRLLARSAADLQHRRLTWHQHLGRYELAQGLSASVEIRGGEGLRRWLGAPSVGRRGRARWQDARRL